MTNLSPLTILPLSVTIIGAAFAIVIFNHYMGGKRKPHELIWSVAFVLFAIAALTQVLADINGGWTESLARIYYLTGAILNVALLGLGTVYLLFSRRVATAALVFTLHFITISIFAVFTTPINAAALSQLESIQWREVFKASATPGILAALGSGIGSVVLIGGALWSGYTFWRKRIMKNRTIGVLLLAVGTFIVALGGTVKGALHNDNYLYPTMAIGVILMFVGYLQTIRPTAPVPNRATQPAPQLADDGR